MVVICVSIGYTKKSKVSYFKEVTKKILFDKKNLLIYEDKQIIMSRRTVYLLVSVIKRGYILAINYIRLKIA